MQSNYNRIKNTKTSINKGNVDENNNKFKIVKKYCRYNLLFSLLKSNFFDCSKSVLKISMR